MSKPDHIFHFRFYSCTDYFSLPPQLTGDWHDLSLASWEQLEDRLRERLDSVASAVTRIEPGTLLRVSHESDKRQQTMSCLYCFVSLSVYHTVFKLSLSCLLAFFKLFFASKCIDYTE